MAGGGGAWKVAYADFVTAMMAFFMVMWITGQSPKVKEAIAEHFRDPFDTDDSQQSEGAKQTSHGSKDKKKGNGIPFQAALSKHPEGDEAQRPKVVLIRNGERTTVGAVAYFAVDSVQLDPESQDSLRRFAALVAGKPQKIEIRGHSLGLVLPEGSPFKSPWEMCYARCDAVLKFLEQEGVGPERVRLCQAAGFEPAVVNVPVAQLKNNSRVEVFLLDEWVQDLVAQPGQPIEKQQPASPEHAEGNEATGSHAVDSHGGDAHAADAHAPAHSTTGHNPPEHAPAEKAAH